MRFAALGGPQGRGMVGRPASPHGEREGGVPPARGYRGGTPPHEVHEVRMRYGMRDAAHAAPRTNLAKPRDGRPYGSILILLEAKSRAIASARALRAAGSCLARGSAVKAVGA